MRTLGHVARALVRAHCKQPFDAVFVTVPPYHTMLLGRYAYHRLGLPYVVDYQDPWSSTYYRSVPAEQRPGGRKWAIAQAVAATLEPIALGHVSHLTAVSRGTLDGITAAHPRLKSVPITELPLGADERDFDYVRAHPRRNAIFDPVDGAFHLSSVGRAGVDMYPVLRALFAGVRLGLQTNPASFSRLKLHFVGTTYAPGAYQSYGVLPLAREYGIDNHVTEHPERVSYLDAIQIQVDSNGLLALGSELPHYTASKIFQLILAGPPLLAIFHRESSVVSILQTTGAAEPVLFSDAAPPLTQTETICNRLGIMLRQDSFERLRIDPSRFEEFTARAMSRRLAGVLDAVVITPAGSSSMPLN